MNSPIMALRVAGTVFALMCLAQLARLLINPEVIVAGHMIPLWPSLLAVFVLGSLSLWLWRLATPVVK